MTLRFILPLLALGLAACGSESEEPKSNEEVIAEMSSMAKPEPGLYRNTTELVEFDIPGLPADQVEQMKGMAGSASGAKEYCLTQEEADKGYEDMVRNMGEGQGDLNCKFDKFDASGDDIDAAMTCTGPAGSSANIAMNGTVQSARSDMTMDMTMKAGPMGEMKMKMKTSSERVGPCT